MAEFYCTKKDGKDDVGVEYKNITVSYLCPRSPYLGVFSGEITFTAHPGLLRRRRVIVRK